MPAEAVDDGSVVVDNRGDAVVVAAEERFPVELDVGLVSGLRAVQGELVDQLHAQRADEQPRPRERGNQRGILFLEGGGGTYDFAEAREEDLDVAEHGAAGAVAGEVGLGPDVPVRAVALLLVLQVERRHRRVVAHLLRHVAHAARARVHHAGEGLPDDRVVGLLAALRVNRRGKRAYVGFVVPAGEVPLEDAHETLVGIVTLDSRR